MKTFKQFQEEYMGGGVTPKMYDSKNTKSPFNIIRTKQDIKKSNEKFKQSTKFPFPLAQKKSNNKKA